MKIVTAEEMRAIDRATSERFGVPSLTLMEDAGAAVADYVLAHYAAAGRVVVFCGKGSNGGDGFVAARRLQERGKKVQVILLADPGALRGDTAVTFGQLPKSATVVRWFVGFPGMCELSPPHPSFSRLSIRQLNTIYAIATTK